MDKFADGFQYGVGVAAAIIAVLALGYAMLRAAIYLAETSADVTIYVRDGLASERDAKRFRRDRPVTNRLGTFINSIIAYLWLKQTETTLVYSEEFMKFIETSTVRRARDGKVLSQTTRDIIPENAFERQRLMRQTVLKPWGKAA